MVAINKRELWKQVKSECRFLKNGKCTVTRNPPDSCNDQECPRKTRFEWIKQSIACILCDFGQCEKCGMVWCKECHAALCLEHIDGHLESCGLHLGVHKFRYEQEFIDKKPWIEA